MKQTLQLRIGQQLTMTPQLQQAIRLLQLSNLELQDEIQEALDSNLMLEVDEESETTADDGEHAIEETQAATSSEEVIPEELSSLDTSWDEIYEGSSALSAPADDYSDRDPLENRAAPSANLHDHLLWQIEMEGLSPREHAIAALLVDAVGDDGYLAQALPELQSALPPDWNVTTTEIEAVLMRIQRLDPIGVAARSPQEALRRQLEQLPTETPWRDVALEAVDHHLERIAERRYNELQKTLSLSAEALDEVLSLIQTLDPRPGSQLNTTAADYIIPDLTVFRHDGNWHVELNSETAPRLRINAFYASLIRRADPSAENHCLRTHLQEARWLIKSLRSRNETLLKVGAAIVERQHGFLDFGEEAMEPLVLREIAEAVEMHESTISRITTNKYMDTPRGTFEFKYFFSSHVQTTDGREASATAIRARIRRLIGEEDPNKPLSDSAIARILEEEGVRVARRTVAKYRETLSIGSSAERRGLPRRAR